MNTQKNPNSKTIPSVAINTAFPDSAASYRRLKAEPLEALSLMERVILLSVLCCLLYTPFSIALEILQENKTKRSKESHTDPLFSTCTNKHEREEQTLPLTPPSTCRTGCCCPIWAALRGQNTNSAIPRTCFASATSALHTHVLLYCGASHHFQC